LTGYGRKDPGGGSLEGGYFWGHFTDANNEFILVGIEAGMLAVISLFGVFVVAFRGLTNAARQTQDIQLKSIYWSFGSSLVGVIAAWQGVSFFGQMNALFYCVLGMIGASCTFAKRAAPDNGRILGTGNTDISLQYLSDPNVYSSRLAQGKERAVTGIIDNG